MKITSIRPVPPSAERSEIHFDGEVRLTIATEVVHSIPLRAGDEVSEELLRSLGERDERWRAREAALRLLSFRGRTAAELRRRLAARGHSAEVVEACVSELSDRGLVDDASFAESFVRDRIRFRPRGSQRLVQELRTKGVEWDTARATVSGVFEKEDVSETALARQAADRWTPRVGETRLRARRRLYNFLARRGFGSDSICEVIEERLP
jgi:regulatory protein